MCLGNIQKKSQLGNDSALKTMAKLTSLIALISPTSHVQTALVWEQIHHGKELEHRDAATKLPLVSELEWLWSVLKVERHRQVIPIKNYQIFPFAWAQ